MSRLGLSLTFALLGIPAILSPVLGQWAPNGVPVAKWTNLNERPVSIVVTRSGRAVIAYQESDLHTGTSRTSYRELDEQGVPGWLIRPEGSDYPTNAVTNGADGVWGVGYRSAGDDSYRAVICPNRILDDSTFTSCDAEEWDAAWTQVDPDIAPDGKGGAFVVWSECGDYISESGFDIKAQRYDPSGNALWGGGGITVCGEYGDQSFPRTLTDGAGGTIVVWCDNWRGLGFIDLFAQRVDAMGRLMWEPGGVYLHADAHLGTFDVVSDGTGGAVVVWSRRGDDFTEEICAQRIDDRGNLLWTHSGVAVRSVLHSLGPVQVISDGAAGAILAWRSAHEKTVWIHSQRLDEQGGLQWRAGGEVVSETLGSPPHFPPLEMPPRVRFWSGAGDAPLPGGGAASSVPRDLRIVENGSGGAIIGWVDGRGVDYDIYAQRLDAGGRPQWRTNGVPVCKAAGTQGELVAAADGSGGVWFAWRDFRALGKDGDVYALRLTANGTLAPNGSR